MIARQNAVFSWLCAGDREIRVLLALREHQKSHSQAYLGMPVGSWVRVAWHFRFLTCGGLVLSSLSGRLLEQGMAGSNYGMGSNKGINDFVNNNGMSSNPYGNPSFGQSNEQNMYGSGTYAAGSGNGGYGQSLAGAQDTPLPMQGAFNTSTRYGPCRIMTIRPLCMHASYLHGW